MGSAVLRPLDEGLAYIYCPLCAQNGTPNVPLRRQMHNIICSINSSHQFSWEQLQRQRAEMVPMSTVVTEQPSPHSVKWAIYISPKTKEILEQKLVGRLHVTIGTLMDSLADDQIIFIQGSEADELKKRGLRNGTQIIAALNAHAQSEKERDDAVEQLERMKALLSTVTGE